VGVTPGYFRVMWTLVPSQYKLWHHRGEDLVLDGSYGWFSSCVFFSVAVAGTTCRRNFRAHLPFWLTLALSRLASFADALTEFYPVIGESAVLAWERGGDYRHRFVFGCRAVFGSF
jgi:hypothetical protein